MGKKLKIRERSKWAKKTSFNRTCKCIADDFLWGTTFISTKVLQRNFFIGFIVAMTGLLLISFNGSGIDVNPLGDILALLSALLWACYSFVVNKISEFGCSAILTTRRIFMYGLLFMLPIFMYSDGQMNVSDFIKPINIFNLLFLELGASAMCYVTWNFSVKIFS